MVRRDRYGEPVDDEVLELHRWEGQVAHARRTARAALPPRESPPGAPPASARREGLKSRLRKPRNETRRV